MKFKADRATLLKALAHVQSVVEKRNTIPILANVLIAVRDGKLSLTATDMEIAVIEDVPASTTRNGACTAPAATLYVSSASCPRVPRWNSTIPAATRSLPCGPAATARIWWCCRPTTSPR